MNITVNEVQVPEEIISKPERSAPDKSPDKLSDQENHPPLEKAVEQKVDDTKESLFSDHADQPQESDYFATENESDGDQGSASPVFRVNNNNAQVDTSNEIIGPTQVDTHPNPILTLGLVEVEALSSPIGPSRQPQVRRMLIQLNIQMAMIPCKMMMKIQMFQRREWMIASIFLLMILP